jgi:hypothetical protein
LLGLCSCCADSVAFRWRRRVPFVDGVDEGDDGRVLHSQGLRPFDPTRGTLALPRDPLAACSPCSPCSRSACCSDDRVLHHQGLRPRRHAGDACAPPRAPRVDHVALVRGFHPHVARVSRDRLPIDRATPGDRHTVDAHTPGGAETMARGAHAARPGGEPALLGWTCCAVLRCAAVVFAPLLFGTACHVLPRSQEVPLACDPTRGGDPGRICLPAPGGDEGRGAASMSMRSATALHWAKASSSSSPTASPVAVEESVAAATASTHGLAMGS